MKCQYIRTVNSYEAYSDGQIKIRYAPREKRVIFTTMMKQALLAAMYRLSAKGPKWMTYGDVVVA